MRKTIYSEPTGGLCNRMGALNYAYLFAKEYDCKLVVLWKDNFEAACRFEDVFTDFDKTVKIRNITFFKKTPKELLKSGRVISFVLRAVWHGILSLYFKYFWSREIELEYESDSLTRQEADAANHARMKEWVDSGSQWCCLSSYQCADMSHDYSALKFRPEFEAQVRRVYEKKIGKFSSDEEYAEFCRKNIVGVHVRRGDHDYAIKNNPLENFASKMSKELENAPDTLFYLASDGADVITYMQEKFGERIIFNEGAELSRKSKNGMENAITDLLALSKSRMIIGSFGSTFSDMASYIGKNKLVYSNE